MIRSINADLTNDMQSYLNILQEEIDFHNTVGAIADYEGEMLSRVISQD